ncbi:MAG: ATP-binding cassette domain-containing protein [Sulfolobales archaeon]
MLVVKDLSIGYDRPLIKGIQLELTSPGLTQVIGPNGVGKTTLLKTLSGLLKPLEGRVFIKGIDVTGNPKLAGKYISFTPQLTNNQVNDYPITVWEFLNYGLELRGIKSSRDEVIEVLDIVGIDKKFWDVDVRKLSGGYRQRVNIARALLSRSSILVLDEPFSNVDMVSRSHIAKVLLKLSKEKLIIVSMHDPTLLLEGTTNIIILGYGKYAFGDPLKILNLDILKQFYGDSVIVVDRCKHIIDVH